MARQHLLFVAILSTASGCVGGGVGYRRLDNAWEPFDGQVACSIVPSFGIESLLGGKELRCLPDVGLAIAWNSSETNDGGSLIAEMSAGAWIPIWHKDWDPVDGGHCVHGGIGASWLEGRFQRDGVSPEDQDRSLAGYARIGYLFAPPGPELGAPFFCFGVELRYTFGSDLQLDGRSLDANGLQLFFSFYAKRLWLGPLLL